MALALGLLCAAAWRTRAFPAWLAGLGTATALLLAGLTLPAFGLGPALPIAPVVTLVSLWMLLAGVWLLRAR